MKGQIKSNNPYDGLETDGTEEETKVSTPKELRTKAEKGELYIKDIESPDFKINLDHWKPRCVDYVYNDYSCVLKSTLHITGRTFRVKWIYCNQDGTETYPIPPKN